MSRATPGATKPLRRVLRINAALTGATAVAVAALAGPLDDMLGTGRPGIVRLVGIGLIAFAVTVAVVARAGRRMLVAGAALIAAADAAWVVASAATIAAGWYAALGNGLVVAVAAVVAALAVAEAAAVRAARRSQPLDLSPAGVRHALAE